MKYRLGRKQQRVILTEDGREAVAFVKGNEELAKEVVTILNMQRFVELEFEDPVKRDLFEKVVIPTVRLSHKLKVMKEEKEMSTIIKVSFEEPMVAFELGHEFGKAMKHFEENENNRD